MEPRVRERLGAEHLMTLSTIARSPKSDPWPLSNALIEI